MDIVKHYEGFYPTPYQCPAGKWTIGYGHLCEPDHPPITEEEATELLKKDLFIAFSQVVKHTGRLLGGEPAHRAAALVSWTFNLGGGNLASSTMLQRIKERDWESAAKEMQRWNKATDPKTGKKRPLAGLTKRRATEAQLFLTGEFTLS